MPFVISPAAIYLDAVLYCKCDTIIPHTIWENLSIIRFEKATTFKPVLFYPIFPDVLSVTPVLYLKFKKNYLSTFEAAII